MTNDEQLARALADQCDSGSGEWMRVASFAGGLDRSGAIFSPKSRHIGVGWIKESSKLLNLSLAVPLQSFLSSGTILTT